MIVRPGRGSDAAPSATLIVEEEVGSWRIAACKQRDVERRIAKNRTLFCCLKSVETILERDVRTGQEGDADDSAALLKRLEVG